MPSGLQVWDSSGSLIFSDSSNVVKFLGFYTIPADGDASGYITVPAFTAYSGHTPFFARNDGNLPLPEYDAQVWISGNNLHWSWPYASPRTNYSVVYGIL